MTWGYVAVAAATVVGGAISADSSRSAANKQRDAANAANARQDDIDARNRADNQPALESRNYALRKLQEMLDAPQGGLDPTKEAGYQFGMDQGMSALNRQATARGMWNSGAALKAGTRYAQDYAGTKYDAAFNREQAKRNSMLNPLQSMAGLGQSGVNTMVGSAINNANQTGANMTALGNAQGAAEIARGNTWANGVNNVAGWYAANQRRPQQTQTQDAGPSNADIWTQINGG